MIIPDPGIFFDPGFGIQHNFPAVLRIHDILGWIRIRIRGSMPLTNGSGSGFGSGSWIRILLFSSLTFKMPAKKLFFNTIFSTYYFLKLHLYHFTKIKSQKEVLNSRNQGFSTYFYMIIEGSWSGSFYMIIEGSGSIPLTSGSGSGSGRPKNTWIRIRIRTRNTAFQELFKKFKFPQSNLKGSHNFARLKIVKLLCTQGQRNFWANW